MCADRFVTAELLVSQVAPVSIYIETLSHTSIHMELRSDPPPEAEPCIVLAKTVFCHFVFLFFFLKQ